MASRTEKELKQIAKDMNENLVFTDKHIPSEQRQIVLPLVFMPLIFANEKTINQMQQNKIDTIFEYQSKSKRVGATGFPTFYSFQVLDDDEAKIVREHQQNMNKKDDCL